jgi:phage terminase large subunit-like protein
MAAVAGSRIYLSGSISGGRADLPIYRAIAARLRAEGFEVLAGEVIDEAPYEPDDRAVFERDMAWLREADVLVAEVSTPSLGVGYEIAAARYLRGIPVVCLFRPGRVDHLSAMIAGDGDIITVRYEQGGLPEALDRLVEAVSAAANKTRSAAVSPA